MQCPAASRWLKQALAATEQRDIVDAVNDAEVLLQILRAECDDATAVALSELHPASGQHGHPECPRPAGFN